MQRCEQGAEIVQPETSGFSLDHYLARVGLAGFKPTEPSLQALTTVIQHHQQTFNYHNTVLYNAGKIPANTREIPSLDINELYASMLERQGGYCYQHSELMFAVLYEIGFTIDRRLAKVLLRPCSQPGPTEMLDFPTHALLIVHLEDQHYLVEVGMANRNMRGPLELKEGEQQIDDDQYRLTKTDELWSFDTKTVRENDWFCLYQFLNVPVKKDDIDNAHNNLYLNENKIPIRDEKILLGLTTLGKRQYLMWSFNNPSFGIFKSVKRNNNGEPKVKNFDNLEDFHAFSNTKKWRID